MMKYRNSRIRQLGRDPGELNITAFMNLMVILVPFLLITAVFSRITILDLNLPASASPSKPPKADLQLEVTILPQGLEVADANLGRIKWIKKKNGDYDYQTLSSVLKQVKSKFPHKSNVMILAQPRTKYDTLVQVMDTVRIAKEAQAGDVVSYELFPDISIGDARTANR